MRDYLEIDHAMAALQRAEADPVNKARELNRRELPKRFYKEVAVAPHAGGFALHLDGAPVRTPARAPLVFARADLAAVAAGEWQAQRTHIDPVTMPMTRLANSVVDGVAPRRTEVAADALKYAASDLLCYRADGPDRLVARQTAAWDPILDWVRQRFGARFVLAEGVMPVAQDPDALAALAPAVERLDAWRLAGLHQMTTIGGSLLAALAVAEGHLAPEDGWQAVALDDLWSLETWGHDDEAAARLALRRRDYGIAADVARGG